MISSTSEQSNSDASDCSSLDSESDLTEGQDLLSFSAKITEELKMHMRRNAGKEDYCEDIYEDKYSSPESGRFSYYSDLLAEAQPSKMTGFPDSAPTLAVNEKMSSTKSQIPQFSCPWTCSGVRNPSVGIGPLKELFRVLDPTPVFSFSTASSHTATDFIMNWTPAPGTSPDFCSDEPNSVTVNDDEYPNFIDIFHRWTNDSFTTPFSSSNENDFRTFGEY